MANDRSQPRPAPSAGSARAHYKREVKKAPRQKNPTYKREDPRPGWEQAVTNGSFVFEVEGVHIGTFRQVQGLQVSIEVETLVEGGENNFEHKFPGRMQWPNIVLRRGVTKSDSLFQWLSEVSGDGFRGQGNKLERGTGAIVAMSSTHERLRSWHLREVFPVRWAGPEWNVGANDGVPEEELEIAHHGFISETHS